MKYFRPTGEQWSLSNNQDLIKEKLSSIGEKNKITPTTKITELTLPFYNNYKLVQLTDNNWEPKTLSLYYLKYEGDLVRLDGTSPAIHKVNANAPIKLTNENVLFYLTFFGFFVRGDEGPFLVIDQLENPYLPNKDTSEKNIPDMIKKIFRVPRAFGKTEQGHWRWSALIYYSNTVFSADFIIQPSGKVEMINDNPVLGDLPAKVDAPITYANSTSFTS